MIIGNNVTLSYTHNQKKIPVLKHISFVIPDSRITLFIGKSGAGKTSVLKCIGSLINSYEGTILYQEQDIKKITAKDRASLVGFVFQQFNLFCHMSVLGNCMQPLLLVKKYSKKQAQEKALETLTLVAMQDYIHAYPSQLSGGQQQRVAIARALCLEPRVLLLDEPTSSLDPESSESLRHYLLELKKKGVTLALASHDMEFARDLIDHIYFLDHGTIKEEYDVQKNSSLEQTPQIMKFLLPHPLFLKN
ncbi:MAG TPA: ATP-binding cassette domain-containing protein [Candidatus Bathyarchaeia archaeon]|nr:ATP-binding cassette domain-containing protein [Candidatus Bathyarchaeia archaeon]